MSKEQQELVGEVYHNYSNKLLFNEKDCHVDYSINQPNKTFIPYSQERFIDKCKTDKEFSEKWGLKIEERELSAKERWDWYRKNGGPSGEEKLVALMVYEDEEDNSHIHSWLKTWAPNVPTKLITITYNDKTIESYEN
jgi:hypothetical protein